MIQKQIAFFTVLENFIRWWRRNQLRMPNFPNKTQIFHRQFQLLFDYKISVLILFQKISLHVTRYTWHAMNLKRNQDKNVDKWD